MNKFVLIPHEEYIRFKDYLVKNKLKNENNETIRNNAQIQSFSPTDKSDKIPAEVIREIEDYQENNKLAVNNILEDTKAKPVSEVGTTEVLPPPGIPQQKPKSSLFNDEKFQQTGNGEKERWIRKWKKNIR